MRLFFYIILTLLIILGVTFALLNSQDIQFNYLFGQEKIYFPLLFLGILFAGAIMGIIALLPKLIKLSRRS